MKINEILHKKLLWTEAIELLRICSVKTSHFVQIFDIKWKTMLDILGNIAKRFYSIRIILRVGKGSQREAKRSKIRNDNRNGCLKIDLECNL
jgi:hypothetical protein